MAVAEGNFGAAEFGGGGRSAAEMGEQGAQGAGGGQPGGGGGFGGGGFEGGGAAEVRAGETPAGYASQDQINAAYEQAGSAGVQAIEQAGGAYGNAAIERAFQANPTTPSYTNLQVYTAGLNPVTRGITKAITGLAVPGLALVTGLLGKPAAPSFDSSPAGVTGAPGNYDNAYSAGTSADLGSGIAPSAVAGFDPMTELESILNALPQPFSPAAPQNGGGTFSTPGTEASTGLLIAGLVLLLAAAAGAYWWYRKHGLKAKAKA